MHYEGMFYVREANSGGGLALFWKNKNSVSLLSHSQNHIDVELMEIYQFLGSPRQIPAPLMVGTIDLAKGKVHSLLDVFWRLS